MRKRIHRFALLLAALVMALPLCAQAVDGGSGLEKNAIRVPKNFKFTRLVDYSALGGQPLAGTQQAKRAVQPMGVGLKAPQHSTFYANAWGDYMGLMSYNPATPEDYLLYTQFDKSVFNAGSTIKDGKLCGIYLDQSMAEYGIIFLWYGWFDLQTGEYDGSLTPLSNKTLVAYATATDPNTGEVFGQFVDESMQRWEFGVADYDAQTRTTVAETNNLYVAMGITSRGDCYGITDDAKLYRIDRTTGRETLIGSTGVNLYDGSGQVYTQGAAIDPKTDIFYWAATDGQRQCTLYTVDLDDASVTRVGTSPYQQIAVNVLPPLAEDKAPAAVTDFAVSFDGPATSGTATFTLPTRTFDGDDALSGQLTYTITANGTTVATASAAPGAQVSVPLSGLQEGEVSFVLTSTNSVGKSPKATIETYVGYDKPFAPTNVTLKRGEDNTATLAWTAPQAGVHGGYIGQLTYNIYKVHADEQTLYRKGVTTTSLDIALDGGTALSTYQYSVEAVNTTQTSDRTMSNNLVVGEALQVPYFEEFATGIDNYTVVDDNHDGNTWTWDGYYGAARYNADPDNKADDWLITPPIYMQKGRYYVVSYKARAARSYFPERLEVLWGKGASVDEMTDYITEETELDNTEYRLFEKVVTPQADGAYFFGFHAVSNPAAINIYIDSVSVRYGCDPASPAQVENLKATPDERGELKVNITFNLPVTTVDGSPLTQVTRYEVLKGDVVLAAQEGGDLQPGQAVSVMDENAVKGVNNYRVYCYNEAGQGARADAQANAGLDYPAPPVVHADDQGTQVRLYWDDITGLYGGVIYQGEVACRIYEMEDENTVTNQVGIVGSGTKEFTLTGLNTDEGTQDFRWWSVRAFNSLGSSGFGKVSLLVGAPYELPFHQSFTNQNQGGHIVVGTVGAGMDMGFTTYETFDGDNGALCFTAVQPDSCQVLFGKVATAQTTSPVMKFYYKSPADVPVRLIVSAKLPNGTETEALWMGDLAENEHETWQEVQFDLPDSLFQQRYFVPQLKVVADDALMDDQYIYIDNIIIGALADGISIIDNQPAAHRYNVFTTDGRQVALGAKSLQGLRPGVYVINGRTTILR